MLSAKIGRLSHRIFQTTGEITDTGRDARNWRLGQTGRI
jgi:hypothetical protein